MTKAYVLNLSKSNMDPKTSQFCYRSNLTSSICNKLRIVPMVLYRHPGCYSFTKPECLIICLTKVFQPNSPYMKHLLTIFISQLTIKVYRTILRKIYYGTFFINVQQNLAVVQWNYGFLLKITKSCLLN